MLIVEDINDNQPLIYFDDTKNIIEIYEETFYTLFQTNELSVVDADLGINAMYNVKLERENFSSAFNIIPQNGYQEQSFSISVLNQNLLDYENLEFQSFEITVSIIDWARFLEYILGYTPIYPYRIPLWHTRKTWTGL